MALRKKSKSVRGGAKTQPRTKRARARPKRKPAPRPARARPKPKPVRKVARARPRPKPVSVKRAARKVASEPPREMTAEKPTVRDMTFITTADMAEALGVHRETVLRYIRAGVIKASRTKTGKRGGRWKIAREFALRFLEGSAGHVPLARPKGVRRKEPPAPDPRQLGLYDQKG